MKKQKGFTLIELLIVIVVIAVLTAIALPSYQEHVRKTRRTQVKADMLEYTHMLEREFTLTRSYAAFPVATYDHSPRTGTTYYDLEYTPDPLDNTYRITATPIGPQAQDTKCGELSIDHRGVKTAAGTLGVAQCW